MNKLRNLAEAEAVLAKYVPAVKEVTGKNLRLERIAPLMKILGDPQNKVRVIHVAGTSGKTSTAYFIASMLKGDGRKVGLTVSPHIDKITERVQINLEPLEEQKFISALSEFLEIIKNVEPQPTYFELLMSFTYWYFAKIQVDYAVIETGFGGLYDGSNVATRADKICVITDIGFDHVHILGDTLQKISLQKAGIIHKDNHAYMYKQSDEVTDTFREYSAKIGGSLTLFDQTESAKKYGMQGLTGLPEYQQRNWLLAREVAGAVAVRDGIRLTDEVLAASMNIKIPGRMDVQTVHGKTLVLDGAHNEQKMTAFVKSFMKKYPNQKAAVTVSLTEFKKHKKVLPILLPITDKLIVTTFDAIQDLPTTSIPADELASAASELGFKDLVAIEDSRLAFSELIKSSNDLLVVTGSFYLVALVRKYIMEGA